MSIRSVAAITGHQRIDDVVPGIRGQRAFPTRERGVLDPFVLLDHIGPERLADDFYVDGVMHPHRGFETLTMMFEGVMYHVDSTGFRETLPTGATQNMNAGSGIQHGGDMAADPESHVFHEVQLWVTTPADAKMDPPAINTAHPGDKPILDRGHYEVEVITGTVDDQTSPLTTQQPTRVLRATTTNGGTIVIDEIDDNWNVFVYVLAGSASVDGRQVPQFSAVNFDRDGTSIEFDAGPNSDILVLTGQPTNEPIVMGGPWVMNTQAELAQADADFEAGLI